MFRKGENFILIKEKGEFYISSANRHFQVNVVGARIFDLCNGRNTMDDIVNKLASIYKMEEKELKKDVEAFIKSLEAVNVVTAE
jgi:hypothetical protein